MRNILAVLPYFVAFIVILFSVPWMITGVGVSFTYAQQWYCASSGRVLIFYSNPDQAAGNGNLNLSKCAPLEEPNPAKP